MVAIVSAFTGGGGKGVFSPIFSTGREVVRAMARCGELITNAPSLRVRIRIPRSLPQALAITRASSWISSRAMIVLRVGSFGDKLSNVDTF